MTSNVAPAEELELSVVIPCLNEERTLGICVEKALRAMRENGIRGEVIVSDNGSDDRSREIAVESGARVVPCPIRGYGAALQWGFKEATGKYVLFADADDSYDFLEIPKLLGKAREGNRYVMGTRLGGTVMPGAMPFLNQHLGTPVLTFILNFLFGTKISDCNSGMRCIERDLVLSLGLSSPGMEFASELIVKAAIAGVPIVEVPITLHPDKRGRPPHLRPWRDGWRHLRLLLWHAPDQTMTNPGVLMMLLGLSLVIPEVFGPVTIGSVRFDIHFMILGITLSMLGASATTMGLVVHAAMPDKGIRTSRLFGNVHEWFTFDRAVIVAVLALLLGLGCDGYVLAHWLGTARGALEPFHTRLSLFGLLWLALGFQLLLAGLLLGTTQTAIAKRLEATRSAPTPTRAADEIAGA